MKYLQLEKGESIDKSEIIGIFDIDISSVSPNTKEFFRRMEEEKGVISLCNDLPKSFLLTDGEFVDRIYITGLSSESIKKRLETDIKTIWKR